ncbi:MAG TPA: hypothetical protein VKW76_00715 [Candidatus Binatia bacterium]|nr:hypothetical protein [Candidatus Binatia bacterium]
MQPAEALLLIGVIAVLYRALAPVRRRLERALARVLRQPGSVRRGRVVELFRRRDGSFGGEGRHGR